MEDLTQAVREMTVEEEENIIDMKLTSLIISLNKINKTKPSRKLSLVITKVEEAQLWFNSK